MMYFVIFFNSASVRLHNATYPLLLFYCERGILLLDLCSDTYFLRPCTSHVVRFHAEDPKQLTHPFFSIGVHVDCRPCGALWLWVGQRGKSGWLIGDLTEVQVHDGNVVVLAEMVSKETRQLNHLDCQPQLQECTHCP